jgi:hypothetical protein
MSEPPWSVYEEAAELKAERDALLRACKVWRNATEDRCRLLSSREATDAMLAPDRALIEAIKKVEDKPKEEDDG